MFKLSKSNNINLSQVLNKGKHLYYEIPAVKRYLRRRKMLCWFKRLSILFIVFILILVIFLSSHFINAKLIYTGFISGQNELAKSVDLLNNRKYMLALGQAKFSENYFEQNIKRLENYSNNYFIKKTVYFSDQFNDAVYLFGSSLSLSRAVQGAAKYGVNIEHVLGEETKFYSLAKEEKQKVLKRIYESEPELHGINANINLARQNLANIEYKGMLAPLKEYLKILDNRLENIESSINKAIPIAKIIPAVFGYPEEFGVLTVFQDKDELWPTGGRVNALGFAKIKDGEINSIYTYNIDYFDSLKRIGPKIFFAENTEPDDDLNIDFRSLRNANWHPDWRVSSSYITRLLREYPEFNNFKYDMVIALNSDFLSEILELSGPISTGEDEYNSDNFASLFKDKSKTKLLGPLLIRINNEVLNKTYPELSTLYSTVLKNLETKNILLNSSDPELQEALEKNNWTGTITAHNKDFIGLIEANISDGLSGAEPNKSLNYKVEHTANGLFSELEINYAHFNGDLDYNNFLRVYVPARSLLVGSLGFSGNYLNAKNEYGFTVFSGQINIKPGEIKSIKIRYKLPFDLDKEVVMNGYSLYVRKQPGSNIGQMTVDVSMLNKVKSYQPTGFNVYRLDDNRIRWETDLEGDREFSIERGK